MMVSDPTESCRAFPLKPTSPTAAALKSFGLIKDVEAGPSGRTLQLTDLALRILLDERESSLDRESAIKQSALLPKIHAQFWKDWGAELPSDAEFRHRLLFAPHEFNENVVDDFIKEYKETIP